MIRIKRDKSNVYVEVEDQGTGVGIRGMRERVRHFRGDLVIESNGSGTKVSATLPLKTPPATHRGNGEQDVA